MILAFTGAGISRASGIPTFGEQPDIRSYLTRDFAEIYPNQYKEVIRKLQETCAAAAPNDAHLAIAEYDITVITMNVDIGLFHRLRRGIMGQAMNLPGRGGRKISVAAYKISQKVVGFN